jgi:hypothetical protein
LEVEIEGIQGHGDASTEYVRMRVKADCDIGNFILADTTYVGPGQVSNLLRHMFWFPNGRVRAGDTIILRTGTGKDAQEAAKGGSTKHRFHWGLGSAVWNDTGDAAVLLKVEEWTFRKAR